MDTTSFGGQILQVHDTANGSSRPCHGKSEPATRSWDPESHAMRTTLDINELLCLILAALPMRDLWRARIVCKTWCRFIRDTKMLRRRLFISQANQLRVPPRTEHEGWWTYPISINPLMNRVFLVPRSGSIVADAVLEPMKDGEAQEAPLWEDLLHSETRPAKKLTVLPLGAQNMVQQTTNIPNGAQTGSALANALAFLAAPSPTTNPPTPTTLPPITAQPSHPPPPSRVLVDSRTRPLQNVTSWRNLELPSKPRYTPLNPFTHRDPAKWKGMYVFDQPIREFWIRHPGSHEGIRPGPKVSGVRMRDLLSAVEHLEQMEHQNGAPLVAENGVRHYEIMLPLRRMVDEVQVDQGKRQSEGLEDAESASENGAEGTSEDYVMWRALKVRLKCRFVGD